MKRFIALLSLAVFTFQPLRAESAPSVFNDLAGMAPGVELAAVPVPEARVFSSPVSSGEELFNYLRQATEPPATKAPTSYSASKGYMYRTADNIGCNGGPGIVTFYSLVCVNGSSSDGNSYRERGDQNDDGYSADFINAEHIWPQGYFKSALPMVADLHHLAPTFSVPNGRRANFKFAEVGNYVYSTSAGSKQGSSSFEPTDASKGNVARALFYFIVRYGDKNIRQGMNYEDFWTRTVPLLLEWNRQDPPDATELRRNDLVESFQGNRNPFIDDHTLADRIGLQTFMKH